jgi:lipid-A-disaccharide synthase
LVNLIADKEVVKELVANDMKVANIKKELASILPGGDGRQTMLDDYQHIIQILGAPGASERAAEKMIECLKNRQSK